MAIYEGFITEEELDEDALDYMKQAIHDYEAFADLMPSDKVETYMIIEQAIHYYHQGLYKKYLMMNNGGNIRQ